MDMKYLRAMYESPANEKCRHLGRLAATINILINILTIALSIESHFWQIEILANECKDYEFLAKSFELKFVLVELIVLLSYSIFTNVSLIYSIKKDNLKNFMEFQGCLIFLMGYIFGALPWLFFTMRHVKALTLGFIVNALIYVVEIFCVVVIMRAKQRKAFIEKQQSPVIA